MAELTGELAAGPSAGSALLREALAEVGDGVRSVAEADFRDLILRSGLPRPVFNAKLFDADGTFIAMVDVTGQRPDQAARWYGRSPRFQMAFTRESGYLEVEFSKRSG